MDVEHLNMQNPQCKYFDNPGILNMIFINQLFNPPLNSRRINKY